MRDTGRGGGGGRTLGRDRRSLVVAFVGCSYIAAIESTVSFIFVASEWLAARGFRWGGTSDLTVDDGADGAEGASGIGTVPRRICCRASNRSLECSGVAVGVTPLSATNFGFTRRRSMHHRR